MVDIELLKARGVTQEALRKAFSCKPDDQKDIKKEDLSRIKALHDRIRSRIQEGMTRNLMESSWRPIYAIDLAYDTPFRQINPTLLQSLTDSKWDGKEQSSNDVFKKVTGLGLDSFIVDEKDSDGKPTGKKMLNAPSFFNLLVPLVKSYVTMRRAAIVNRHNQTPFMKYEPVKTTTLRKLQCEALTDRTQVMSEQYSFFEVFDQCVLKTLQYGTQLQFIADEWDSEKQLKKATADDVANKVKNAKGEECKEGDEIELVTKEGLRYKLPHPSRTFRDLAFPQYTYNSDSGAMFSGYWEIARYKDLLNRGFWNVNAVSIGNTSIIDANTAFFQSVYSSCKLTIPVLDSGGAAAAGVGTTSTDSERKLALNFYGSDNYDQGVLVSHYFEKLVPSENGLGDYPYPVWFRFDLAGDGMTVMYATPLPGGATIYYGYDPDDSRVQNSSFALEVLPFQDHFGMMLSQIILTAKQNLANISFINEDLISKDWIERIRNFGESIFRTINLIPVPFKKLTKMQTKVAEASESFTLPKGNTAELTNVLKTILDVCDRVMQISNIELAQSASHEQSAEEVRTLTGSTSNRLDFTATPIEKAKNAWKRQIYLYTMAYGDKDFYAHIPSEPPLTAEELKKLGFTYADEGTFLAGRDKFRRIKVDKAKAAHNLWEFASDRDDTDRVDDAKMAIAMGQIIQPLIQNPLLLQSLGADQIIEIANKIGQKAGFFDRDFKLYAKNVPGTPEEQKKQAAKEMEMMLKMVSQIVDAKLKKDLEPILKELKTLQTDIAVVMHSTGTVPEPPPQPNAPPNNQQPIPASPQVTPQPPVVPGPTGT